MMVDKLTKSEEEWCEELSSEQFEVLRKKGTEHPYTGKYWDEHRKGTYNCAACGQPLFDSETKFDSGTGWPSFTSPVSDASIETSEDTSYGRVRTEVLCSRCESHLGHVFDDGPLPTGMRYCINSAAIDLETDEEEKSD